jgi:hypothetical protein
MGHERAATRRAQNQQDGQEQPTQPLPYHPACLTCFRPFAKKIFSRKLEGIAGLGHRSASRPAKRDGPRNPIWGTQLARLGKSIPARDSISNPEFGL